MYKIHRVKFSWINKPMQGNTQGQVTNSKLTQDQFTQFISGRREKPLLLWCLAGEGNISYSIAYFPESTFFCNTASSPTVGGGGLEPIPNFESLFCAPIIKEFSVKQRVMDTSGHVSYKVYFKYGHFESFWKVLFFPFLGTKTIMCLIGSITAKNKGGGGGGQTPYGRLS